MHDQDQNKVGDFARLNEERRRLVETKRQARLFKKGENLLAAGKAGESATVDNHPWIQASQRAKEGGTEEQEHQFDRGNTSRRQMWLFGAVFALSLVIAVFTIVRIVTVSPVESALPLPVTFEVWHSLGEPERTAVNQWIASFLVKADPEGRYDVVLDYRTDLREELHRAILLGQPPHAAIVDEETARDFASLGALEPIVLPDDDRLYGQDYLRLSAPTPWTMPLAAVVFRKRGLTEKDGQFILGFARFLEAQATGKSVLLPTLR